jgi:hypothetical protein
MRSRFASKSVIFVLFVLGCALGCVRTDVQSQRSEVGTSTREQARPAPPASAASSGGERPPPPKVTTPMAGEPSAAALGGARLVTAGCEGSPELARRHAVLLIKQMQR